VADGVIQVPPDSTGAKTRTRTRVVGANTVHEQYIAQSADPTYYVWSTPAACAQNRQVLSLLNTSATQVIKVRKLFLINAQLTAVTGVGLQYDVKRISTLTGGTAITPNPADTADGALSGFTCAAGGTVTEGVLLYSWYTMNDEIGVTAAAAVGGYLQASISMQPEGNEVKELNLRNGEGFTVKQITNSTVGSYGALAVVTVEAI
jgi:hypothetical protein